MTLKVIQSGITLIEDQGRYGFGEIGISRSGAFDQVSFRLANSLLGRQNEPAFEIIQGRFELEASSNAIVAIVGNAKAIVDSNLVSVNTSFQILAKQRLVIEPRFFSNLFSSCWNTNH